MISNRWKIVLLATFFNLSWEYASRGLGGFFKPVFLSFLLFGFYFTLYSMLEDLIVRFKLRNYQLVLAAFLYGLFPLAFGSRDLFAKPQFLGINWFNLFYIGFLWWGILQAIFTFYFANRLVQRDWQHPLMGKVGWILAVSYNAVVFLGITFLKPYINKPSSVSFFVFALIFVFTAIFLWKDIKRNTDRKQWKFISSKVMDFLSFGSFVLFLVTGTFVATGRTLVAVSHAYFNPIAIRIVKTWTLFYSIVFLLYWWRGKKEITL